MIPPEQPHQSGAEGVGVFATTHWSVVVRAGDSGSAEAASAMERLCQTYWYPLYVFVRRKGYSHEEASDLTQAFRPAIDVLERQAELLAAHRLDPKIGPVPLTPAEMAARWREWRKQPGRPATP